MGRTRQLSSRRPRRAGALALLAAPLLVVAACSGSTPPPPTVKVDRGSVTSGVSASGTLVSIKEQNLGFADRGQVKELMVKVGDVVQPGQPLARLDDAAAQSQLASAKAKLDQQNAALGKQTGSNAVQTAQSDVDSAGEILDATRRQVDATAASDSSATDRAQVKLGFDQKQLDKAEDTYDDCKDNPSKYAGASSGSGGTTSGGSTGSSSGGTTSGLVMPTPTPTPTTAPAPDPDIVCAQYKSARDQAKATVIADQTSLDAAQQKENTDAAQGAISIANAKKSLADAQNSLTNAQTNKPFDDSSQDAAVRDSQNSVNDAQTAVDNTVLKAPIAGTVSAINGAVGDFIAAEGGAGGLAPGSDARIPPATSAGATTATSGTSAASFITLNNVDTFQLVVPFEESDAAKLAPNQTVDVSVDAVPGVTEPGTVVAVSPTAEQVSGVVSYYTTVVLNQSDPRFKDGQTASAQVTTQNVDDVLRVPSSTVRTADGRSTVNVPGPDGNAIATQFTPGLAGDAFTEVKDGLREGQDILVPQATVTATQGGGGPGGGGGRGGGG